MATKAIVTILIGQKYQDMWTRLFRETWVRYARRHGYDIYVVSDYIDKSPRARERTPHWQKCLVLEVPDLRRYEHVVWIDADILINPHTAPCIVEHNNSDKIGIVSYRSEFALPARWDNRYHRRARNGTGGSQTRSPDFPDWYRQLGLNGDVTDFTNTGVLVMKPALHADFMRHIYDTCQETPNSLKENGPLSYWLFKTGNYNLIDPRFNVSWNGDVIEFYPFLLLGQNFTNDPLVGACVNVSWHNAWFLHFIDSATRDHARLVQIDRTVPEGVDA